jgi:CSLREA domain-containing protein
MIFNWLHRSWVTRRLRWRGLAVLLPGALVLLAPAALASTPQAATLKVTTTADELTSQDGLCSLREAVAAINAPGTATDCGTAGSTSNTIQLLVGHYVLSIAPTGADVVCV